MKTKKLLLTATVVAIVAIATAVEKPKMSVVPLAANQAVISITNENPAYFEVSIETPNGDLVYYKQSSKPLTRYQKTFDVTNLENGNYILSLKVNDTKLTKEIEIASSNIYVGDSKLRFDPFFSFDDNLLKFSFLNFEEENFKLNILKNGELVYQKKLGKNFTLSKGYDLSNLKSGNYEVLLTSYQNKFTYSLVK